MDVGIVRDALAAFATMAGHVVVGLDVDSELGASHVELLDQFQPVGRGIGDAGSRLARQ